VAFEFEWFLAMAGKEESLRDLIEPVVTALDCELWGIEYNSQGRHTMVRIYIDGPNGVTIDDCANVSRQLSSVFDVEDPITGEYNLEVSSPGLDRPLFSLSQYKQFIGEQVQVRLRSAFEGRRKFTGRLVGIEGDEVVLVVDEHEYLLPFDLIDKAKIISGA
jgi:ribosome maturation factor RimP